MSPYDTCHVGVKPYVQVCVKCYLALLCCYLAFAGLAFAGISAADGCNCIQTE